MLARAALTLWAFSLLAQEPPGDGYQVGRLIQIVSHPETPSYTYIVLGYPDEYWGVSGTSLRVHENTSVKFAIRDTLIYIVDEDGKVQRMRLLVHAEGHPIE